MCEETTHVKKLHDSSFIERSLNCTVGGILENAGCRRLPP